MSNSREIGFIKFFDWKKGYGFIAGGSGVDVFVHKNDLPAGTKMLEERQQVSFVPISGKRGLRASELRLL